MLAAKCSLGARVDALTEGATVDAGVGIEARGRVEAAHYLGEAYQEGRGVKRDFQAARRFLEETRENAPVLEVDENTLPEESEVAGRA